MTAEVHAISVLAAVSPGLPRRPDARRESHKVPLPSQSRVSLYTSGQAWARVTPVHAACRLPPTSLMPARDARARSASA